MRSGTANDMKDGELLEAFRTLGDQDAFTALMRRHGQMVHGTARAMVGDAAVAEDVAQATFLALARKAGLLERADSVAGWLYHVALCLARNEYRAQVRRKAREEEAAMIATEPDSGTFAEGVVSTLYEELGNLAEKYRQPVILHHLEGLSYEAAAPMCGCTEKAFSVRLTRGREQLRDRLAKRGVALGITALVAGLSQSVASAAELPAALVASTCQAATGTAAGGTVAGGGIVSAKVAALTESAMKMLFWAKVKTAAAAVVLTAGVAVAGGFVAHQVLAHRVVTAPAPQVTAQGGQVWAWGGNAAGQLGDGTTNNRPIPVRVPELDGVIAIAAGIGHAVALQRDHTVWAWGDNNAGQLGDGTTTNRSTPVPVKLADGTPLADVSAIAAGWRHTLALKRDGSVMAWGDNSGGQLGDGTTVDRHAPVQVSGLFGVTALAGGDGHSVAVKRDGSVWAWGNNRCGQLGDGTTTDRRIPAQVSGLSNVMAVALGGKFSVALQRDGSVWAWGLNHFGQLGNGKSGLFPSWPVPGRVIMQDGSQLRGITAIAAGFCHTVALKSDGTAWKWGGQQLQFAVQPYRHPVLVSGVSNVTAIAGGMEHNVALKNDGSVWAWGKNEFGQLGDGTSIPRDAPMQVLGLSHGVSIAAGNGHTLVLTRDEPPDRKTTGINTPGGN